MSEHASVQRHAAYPAQAATNETLLSKGPEKEVAESSFLQSWQTHQVYGDFAEPRIGFDFSRVPAHAGLTRQNRPMLRTRLMVQQFRNDDALDLSSCPTCSEADSEQTLETNAPSSELPDLLPETTAPSVTSGPAEATGTPEERTASGLIVEDTAETVGPGQMRRSEFLAQLRTEVTRAAEAALAGTGRTTADCPYLEYWFGYYSRKDSMHIERAIRKYAPDTSSATTAGEYIAIISQRAGQAADRWARTGEITGVPEGIPTSLPGASPAGGEEGAEPSTGTVMFKAREGGARAADDPQAIQRELGEGSPLDSGVRSRMESTFGMAFSHVRTHTDTTAVGLSNRLNARAFTVGEHIAFGAGEYQPGTLIGDALIAHELAHVVQQGGASGTVAPIEFEDTAYNTLEKDADKSAVSAIGSLWGGTKDAFADTARTAVPRFRSGLRLSRCRDRTTQQTPQRSTILVRTTGNKSATNDKSFPAGYQGDTLGALTDEDDSITIAECTGKVEIVGTLWPGAPITGWDIKRNVTYKTFSNSSLSESGTNEDDTSLATYKDLTPDANRKIYDIDGPTVGYNFNVNHTKEAYNNFTQWITLNGNRVSDEIEWHYQARVDDDLDAASRPRNDDTELNDLGTGHITIPSNAHYSVR